MSFGPEFTYARTCARDKVEQALDGFLQWHFDLLLEVLFLAFDGQVALHFLHPNRLFKLSLLVVDVKSVVYHDGQRLLHIL